LAVLFLSFTAPNVNQKNIKKNTFMQVMKVILFIATTLDGYIARDNGSVDFLDPFNESGENYGFNDLLQSVSAIVMGNTTFEEYHSYPQFFEGYKGKDLYIFSRDATKKHPKVTFTHDNPMKFLSNLQTDKDIWLLGGSKLIKSFQNEDLIDEYIITIIPVIIGSGIPLFRKPGLDIHLKLEKTESFESGVVNLYYTKK